MQPRVTNPNAEIAAMSVQQNPAQSRVSLRDLCALFCCPPFPSAIVSKLAFMPPEPSYKIEHDPETKEPKMHLLENRAEFPHGEEEFRNVEIFYTRTRRSNKIACVFLRPCGANARFTIMFSHGNAVDLGQMCSFYYGLGYRLGVNVFSYDYSGYGCSTGRPSEKNLYADIVAALHALKTRYNIKDEQVILYGQSIGTVPSVDLASSNPNIAALILHSPLLSGLRVACAGVQRTWCCDAFPSIDKIPQVQCPTLIIHGVEDEASRHSFLKKAFRETVSTCVSPLGVGAGSLFTSLAKFQVIDFSHGLTLYENCPSSVEPLWVAGAGHNDVELHQVYLDRLRAFIENEAAKPRSTNSLSVPKGTL